MTSVNDPLLGATDFAQFNAKADAWFLGAAGEQIRDYCGWHIFPQVAQTDVIARIGNAGIIMLPTLNLVSVQELRIRGQVVAEGVEYWASSAGYITLTTQRLGGSLVSVDMTHGYEALPKAVAEVGFELASRTMEQPSGIVTDITRGPTRMKFGELGSVLSDDQKGRLGPYRVRNV